VLKLPPVRRALTVPRRGPATALVIAVVTVLGASACGTLAGSPTPRPSWASPQLSSPADDPGRTSITPTGTPDPDITLEFAGDVHFFQRTAKLLADPSDSFGPIGDLLADADVTSVNLETVVTDRGTPQPKTFHFRTVPTAFDALRGAGIDAVTIANNHILDYGRIGLADTLAAAKAKDFPVYGAGNNADQAWAPWVTSVKGTRFAYLGVSDVQELESSWIATPTRSGEAIANDLTRTLDAVRAAHKVADVVVVFMHWGTEGQSCPNSMQRTLAKQLSDAGANIIIGSHVHTLQGSGWLGNTFVAYGMGNFLWYMKSWSTETGVLKLTLHPGAKEPYDATFTPAVVSNTGQPVVQTGAKGAAISKRYASLRACAGLSASPTP